MVGVDHDLMAALTLDVGNETDAAAVVLEIGMIETCGRWPAGASESL